MAVDLSRVNKNSAMGATVRSDGTGFRTWAPNANTVSLVAGNALAVIDEPPWRPASEDHLAALGDGSWGGFLAGVGDGDPCMFRRGCRQYRMEAGSLRARAHFVARLSGQPNGSRERFRRASACRNYRILQSPNVK